MSNLGIGPPPPHHISSQQNMRLTQQSIASAMSPQMVQNMRLSPQTNLASSSMGVNSGNGIGGQRQTPPTVPISSPQNLTISPGNSTGITSSSTNNQTTPHSLSPNSPGKISSRTGSIDQPSDISDTTEIRISAMAKESALNMSRNNSDMRTNSIATLRIKAKEHLESINKGLTMV